MCAKMKRVVEVETLSVATSQTALQSVPSLASSDVSGLEVVNLNQSSFSKRVRGELVNYN